ncbi:MAG TPA: hypothetical protein VKU02_22355 [Gemmataceae bacterium]|nr:hypothetical protein [Gemmataceae bacterium]
MPSLVTVFFYALRLSRVLLLGGVVALALGEIYLRLPFIPQRLEYIPDEELGGVLAPSQRGCYWMGSFSVQSVPMTVNSDGHRGHETDWSQPVLLALGDSQGFGSGLPDEEVYTAILEASLQEQPGLSHVQVANASGAGFGPYQQLVMLRRVLAKRPVAAVLVRVSIEDRSFEPIVGADLEREVAKARRNFAIRRWTRLLPHMYNRVQLQLPSVRTALNPWFLRPEFLGPATAEGGEFSPALGQKMWRDFKSNWEEMAALAAARGIPAIFFLYDPQGDRASAGLWEAMQQLSARYSHCHLVHLGPASFHLDKMGFDKLTLEERMGDSHANGLQNRYIAEALLEFLMREQLVPRSQGPVPPRTEGSRSS